VKYYLGKAEVIALCVCHHGEVNIETREMGASDLLVEGLGEDAVNADGSAPSFGNSSKSDSLDTKGVRGVVGPESDLGEDLVGEGARHDPRRVAGGASEVDKTSLSEEDDVAARRHGVAVDLGLDVGDLGGGLLEPSDVNLDVEVTVGRSDGQLQSPGRKKEASVPDVADDGILGHDLEVLATDDVAAAGGGDEDVSLGSGLLHGENLESGHGSLEGVDGVDLGDDDTGSVGAERLGASLSNISVAGDDGDLSGEHDIGGTLDTVNEGLAAAVKVVELGLGD
jgi:hypothetical protein